MNTQSISPLPAQCTADQSRLAVEFSREFDPSKVEQFARRIMRNDSGVSSYLLGDGADCFAYRVPATNLVLSIPKTEFWQQAELAKWRRSLESLQRLGTIPLIPPLRVMDFGDAFGLATPYGPDSIQTAASHWQPLDQITAQTQKHLSSHRLVINDVIQLRVRQGLPFIVDLSDLRSI